MNYARMALAALPGKESIETAEAQALVAVVYALLAVDERLGHINQNLPK